MAFALGLVRSLRILLGLMLASLPAAGGCGARPIEPWHWVRVEADGGDNGWSVTKGVGEVSLGRDRLVANLRTDPAAKIGADIRLVGRVVGNHVFATETLIGTDATPTPIAGTIERKVYRDADGLRQSERIIFVDDGRKSGLARFIGITKGIQIGR